MREQDEEQQRAADHAEQAAKDEEAKDELPGWAERIAQQRYLLTLKSGPQNVEEAFEKAGVPIGAQLESLVVRFEISGSGEFTLILREAARVQLGDTALHFDTRSTGRLTDAGLEAVSGLKITDQTGERRDVVSAEKRLSGTEIDTDEPDKGSVHLPDLLDP